MTVVFAAEIGATALYLLFGWLGSAAIAGYLSDRKGYGERPGLASGLFLTVIGIAIWIIWPAREDSLWKKVGPFGRPHASDAPPRDAATAATGDTAPPSADTTERT